MHLVYPVRPGVKNEELRYSLRSVEANLPVESVTIVGYCPPWLKPDLFIAGNKHVDKQRNVFGNVRLACEHDGVPDEFVSMNDDFFVLAPVTEIPVVYRGRLADHLELIHRHGWWWKSMEATMRYLLEQGIEDPLSYDLHRPLPTVKRDMAKVLAEAADYQPRNPPQWRTLYGNLAGIGGTQDADDVKVYSAKVEHRARGPFVSTTDSGFATTETGARIRAAYTTPSRWER